MLVKSTSSHCSQNTGTGNNLFYQQNTIWWRERHRGEESSSSLHNLRILWKPLQLPLRQKSYNLDQHPKCVRACIWLENSLNGNISYSYSITFWTPEIGINEIHHCFAFFWPYPDRLVVLRLCRSEEIKKVDSERRTVRHMAKSSSKNLIQNFHKTNQYLSSRTVKNERICKTELR